MALTLPDIDDRRYDDLLAEAVARIRVHNPEWTNFNDADPGITLIQVFAFLTDALLYRANRIPERNRLKFLSLLGVPLQPAAAAQGLVTFSNPRGPLKTFTLGDGTQVFAGKVPYRTQDGIDVLPIEGAVYYKAPSEDQTEELTELYEALYESLKASDLDELAFYESAALAAPETGADLPVVDLARDTLDGSLWVALLARSAAEVDSTRKQLASRVLTLGILPALTDATRVLRPGGDATNESAPQLSFQLPIGGSLPEDAESRVARYRVLSATPSGDLLTTPGVVHLTLPAADQLTLWDNLEPTEQGVGDFPPSLEDTDVADRVVTWIRIRASGLATGEDGSNQVAARVSWVGVNASRVTQRARVTAETLGRGTGEPDQELTLANTPVIVDSVTLHVNGEPWTRIDDLSAAPPEVPVRSSRSAPGEVSSSAEGDPRVYTVDRASGAVRFGDGLRGKRPAKGAVILAAYDYGGGVSGVLGIGAITKGPSLPAGVKVANPIPTWGGAEAETTEEGEKRIAAWLRHRDRLVSVDDFEEIAYRTPGVDVGRVEVLPLFHPELVGALSQGVVTVMVLPRYDADHPGAPEPDLLFLDAVCAHLSPRRLVTTEIHVRGPTYVPIWVSVGIEVVPGRDVPPVREAVAAAITSFLSPLEGGIAGEGWPLEKAVEALELWAVATRVDGVAKVTGVNLGGSSGEATDRVTTEGLELPRLEAISVASGEALDLGELRGDAASAAAPGEVSGEGGRVLPVPVVPTEC